jgi:hypothetical protein
MQQQTKKSGNSISSRARRYRARHCGCREGSAPHGIGVCGPRRRSGEGCVKRLTQGYGSTLEKSKTGRRRVFARKHTVRTARRPSVGNKLVGKEECLAFQRAIPSLMNPTTRPPGPRPGIHVADLISRSRLANRLRALGGPPSRTQIIHQSWRAHELPSTLRPLSASWTQLSGWRHRLWTDDENRALWAAKLTVFSPLPPRPL